MEREIFRKTEMNRSEKCVSNCKKCGSRMSANQACEHLAVFHPQIITLVQKISNKVNSFPIVKRKFSSMDCRNLCAAKITANKLIENWSRYDPHSLGLIQQLSEKITSASDFNCISSNQKNCSLCDLRFLSTRLTIAHFILCHPECLALVQFLRCRSLSELNFQKDIVALSKTKTQELIRVITSPTILASRQPFVKLEKLPSHLYQKCITKGYVEMKDITGSSSVFGAQPNSRLHGVSAEVMKKIRETVENAPYPNKSNVTVIVVPKNILKTLQGKRIAPQNKDVKSATLPTTHKIIRYGVEDLERDRVMRQQKKEKIGKKEKILKKMLAKYHEKETKKVVLYWQKVLTRYVMQHRKVLSKLEDNLINARKRVTSKLCGEQLLERVDFCVLKRHYKVRKTLKYLLNKLFDAMEKVPAVEDTKNLHLTSGESSFEKVDPVQNITVKNTKRLCLTSGESSFEKVDPIQNISVKNTKRLHLTSRDNSIEKVDPIKDISVKDKRKRCLTSRDNSFEKGDPIQNISVKNTKKRCLTSEEHSLENVNKPPRRRVQKCSTPKVRNDKKKVMPNLPAKGNLTAISSTSVRELGSGTADPFVNLALITDDKQLFECFCGKLNCVGLHPENFY